MPCCVNDQASEHREDKENCSNGHTIENLSKNSGSGLEDDLSLSSSDGLSLDAYDIIKPTLLSSPNCRLSLRKRTLPIPRKPDYVPKPYQSDHSNDENEPPESNLVVSKRNDSSGKRKLNRNSTSILSENSNKIYINDTKIQKIEKRNMFIRVNQVQLDSYDINFLKRNEKNVRAEVSGMCHSLRFWLAVKFSSSLTRTKGLPKSGALTKAKICRLLGIDGNSFFKSRVTVRDFSKFDGLSPLEFSNLKKCTHLKIIKRLALNFHSPLVQNIISVKKNE